MSDGDSAGREVLRILILEDDPRDAELAQRLLTREGVGFTATVVDTRAAFEAELTAFRPDVILSDFSLPGFSGATALAIAQERCKNIPFIIMSGVLGDESAVELIKQGATDYVLKDRPARLPSVIRRAVAEAAQRARLAQLEAQLRRWQRMASLGRLAAGAAYEFNNQVCAMLKSAAAIREKAAHRPGLSIGGNGWDGVRKDAEQIQHAGGRANRLVHQLLEAAGQEMVSSELIDLNQVVSGSEDLLRSTIGERVEFRLSPAPGLWPVQADPVQVRQVLLNLAVNASEAMPDGGTFSIAMQNVSITGSESLSHPELGPGDYVCVSVSDTGTGMEPEVLEHALEPFFTTKPFAAGGGLGLASVYGIVRQAGGTVDISSAPGAGTTVIAWLRAVTSDLATSTGAPASIGQPAS
ncbi:MAG: ATP-binding protein [Streptosporangiaceae bacterium]|jgi:signal transduction histidine kinase